MKFITTKPLRFAIMSLVLLASGLIFASLAEDILNRETFFVLDPVLGAHLISKTTLQGNRLFSLITLLGNAIFISSSMCLLGFWFAKQKRWQDLLFLFASVAGATALNLSLKLLIARPRPDFPQAFSHDIGYSFPSGHATISIAFYGALAYLLVAALKSWRYKALVIFGVFLISLLVGFSRLYLGVHYLSDILAGWAAGGVWLVLCIFGGEYASLLEVRPGQ